MVRMKRVSAAVVGGRQLGISNAIVPQRSGRVRKKTETPGIRLPNMKMEEEDSLIELVLQFWDVLEAKRQDAATNTQRNNAWNSIHVKYNAINLIVRISLSHFPITFLQFVTRYCFRFVHGQSRDIQSLRNKFPKLKNEVRQQVSEYSRKLSATGGGSPPTPLEKILSPAKLLLASKIQKEICGDSPPLGDCDVARKKPDNLLMAGDGDAETFQDIRFEIEYELIIYRSDGRLIHVPRNFKLQGQRSIGRTIVRIDYRRIEHERRG